MVWAEMGWILNAAAKCVTIVPSKRTDREYVCKMYIFAIFTVHRHRMMDDLQDKRATIRPVACKATRERAY
jgi:hypothetical protein